MSESWRLWAACKGKYFEADLTFDHPLSAAAKRFVKDYCDVCPVREECLDFALEFENTASRTGVYGGLTAKYRRRLEKDGRRVCSECREEFIPPAKTVWRCWDCRSPQRVTGPGPVSVHGTRAGAAQHWRRGEKPCGPCSAARSAYDRAWAANRRGAA